VIYFLRPDHRIVYCRRAWDKFATENSGENLDRSTILGTVLLDVTQEPLLKFYSTAFAEVHKTCKIWEQDFECSSFKIHRLLHTRLLQLPSSHVLVENSTRVEELHHQEFPPTGKGLVYVNEYGILTMCCHGRRTRRVSPNGKKVWGWIPGFLIEQPGRVSPGLCHTCRTYF
jgi:hypothetical protein